MNPSLTHFPSKKTRIGFHYFPDTLHYREADVETWLPELEALGTSWLVVQSSYRRAIPENFLSSLLNAGIEPIVQFNLPLDNPPSVEETQTLVETYARNGVNGVIFFDRPNDRLAWQSSDWAQQDLVERFLDHYIPFANMALQNGMNPIFPALEPGGSYWDTAFLRSAIESLIKRKQSAILYKLVLSAYAWTGNHHLNWGSGGPQRWTESKPYFTPENQEDQRGFRIYEWYSAITQALLHDTIPIILLGAGANADPVKTPAEEMSAVNTDTNMSIARLLTYENEVISSDTQTALESIPNHVISCNYWLLSAEATSAYAGQAWYKSDGSILPVVSEMKSWVEQRHEPDEKYIDTKLGEQLPDIGQEVQTHKPTQKHRNIPEKSRASQSHNAEQFQNTEVNQTAKIQRSKSLSGLPKTPVLPIDHYLLIPTYEWGIADWHLNVITPYIKKHSPTVGFSLDEAKLAKHVTVVGNQQTFPEEQLEELRQNGSYVERISGDGTSIASQLAER